MWDLTSPTKDRTCVPCIAGQILNHRPPGKSPSQSYLQTPMPSSKRATSRLVTCCCPGQWWSQSRVGFPRGPWLSVFMGPSRCSEEMSLFSYSWTVLCQTALKTSMSRSAPEGWGVDSAQLTVLVLSPHWGPCAPWALLFGFPADSSIWLPACKSSPWEIHILCTVFQMFFSY